MTYEGKDIWSEQTANDIVIDTNIWVRTMVNEEFDVECDEALHQFLLTKRMRLVLDYEGEIMQEYNDNVREERRFQIWMKRLDAEQRKCWVSSRLSERYGKALRDLGFHEAEDHVFVGAAMNADKFIISEDSDYGVHGETDKQKVIAYMKEQMGLQVVSAAQFTLLHNKL